MGYHFTEIVYRDVEETTSTQQAVLAYLAHRTRDETGLPSFHFPIERIAKETHFGVTAVKDALKELARNGIVTWKQGGRLKGNGGKAYANEYYLHLEKVINKNAVDDESSIGREPANALAGSRPMHSTAAGQCISRQPATIHKRNIKDRNKLVVHKDAPAPTTDDNSSGSMNCTAEEFKQIGSLFRVDYREKFENDWLQSPSPVYRAMAICEVNDVDNKRVFSITMMKVGKDRSMDIVNRFISEIRQGEHKTLDSKGRCRVLMDRLNEWLPAET